MKFPYLISQCLDLWLSDYASLLLQLDNQPEPCLQAPLILMQKIRGVWGRGYSNTDSGRKGLCVCVCVCERERETERE